MFSEAVSSRHDSDYDLPRPWDLNDANQPLNEIEFLKSIIFLEDHPEWVKDNEEEARRCFTHLTQTDLSPETEACARARKIQASLVRSYPGLFPAITLRIGTEEIRISKILLMEKSEKFRSMFSQQWKDSEASEIILEGSEGINSQVLNSFLHFLTRGEAHCTDENVPHLLRLAQEHFVPELTAVCNGFLENKFRNLPLQEMLMLAVRYNITDLKWQCLIFASKNSEERTFKAIFQQLHDSLAGASMDEKKELEEAISILETGTKCAGSGIIPCFMGSQKTRAVELDQPLFDAQFLKTLVEIFAVDGLKITGDFATDQDLDQLAKLLPMPHFLLFRGSKIENIPKKWLDQVKEIDCSNCRNVTVLEVPCATGIEIRDCRSLIELYAPEAIKIDCSRSSLRTLNAPLAEIIYANTCPIQRLYAPLAKRIASHDCHQLREVYAPIAEEINCFNCRSLEKFECKRVKRVYVSYTLLKSLDVPLAQHVDCSNNIKLKILNAPMAEHIDCQGNNELLSLDAPMAQTLILRRCSKLSRIDAPMAKKIDCSGLPVTSLEGGLAEEIDCSDTQLTTLKALMAKKINCSGTPLTSLEAPIAEVIDCSNTPLTHLKAPMAKEITCSKTPLKSLEAPLVEDIDCSWTQLTSLDVPKAKTVKSRFCRLLECLNAPMANWIDCCACDRLLSLLAQMAQEILMLDCSGLKWLDAPLAKKINGSRCTLLEGINAPLAEWMNCTDCINLKHVNAPHLKEKNFVGCLALAIPDSPENIEINGDPPVSLLRRVKDSFDSLRKKKE